MDVRPAKSSDSHSVETLAHDSLRSSYSLSPQRIKTLVQHEFDAETMAGWLDDPDVGLFVAEDLTREAKNILGFIVMTSGEERTIRWLHVDPQARGEGIATALLAMVGDTHAQTPLVAQILNDAVEGGEFLERIGLESDRNEHIRVGGDEFAVSIYTERDGLNGGNEPSVAVPSSVSVDGVERHVDRDERIPGRNAPFFTTHTGERGSNPFGYFCSNCGSTDVRADALDRIECGECENSHSADRWDDSFL